MSTMTLSDRRFQAVLEPKRLIRWVYVARLSLAWAIMIAALRNWFLADSDKTLVATLTFVVSHLVTVASFVWSDVRGRPLTPGFLYGQLFVDVLAVTGVVHVTDGQFAALYILVYAVAAILLSVRGALLVTALGLVLYTGDVLLLQEPESTLPLVLQLFVFSLAGVGVTNIAVQLKAAGVGREALAAELKRVRLREADILQHIRSGIVSISADGALLFANANASTLLGVDLGRRLGRPVVDDIAAVAPGLADALRRAAADGSGGSRTEGLLTRDGATVPLGVTTTTTGDDAASRTITAIFQDISDQKRLEQLHLRAQRLEAVTELSASLAHEIKNPLASIRSAVEQISRRPAATVDERTLGTLIVRESDRLSRLLSEFLDFARVRVTRVESVDLGGVVRAACRLADAHPGKPSGVRIEVEAGTTPLVAPGDEDLLHRAMSNLALNAVQASPENAVVRVRVSAVPPSSAPRGVTALQGGAIRIDVADAGSGIDAAVRDRLFEPFTTTKVGGSGLGLAIAHRAIEAHRGVILVDSTEAGTTFSVFLPVTPAAGDPS